MYCLNMQLCYFLGNVQCQTTALKIGNNAQLKSFFKKHRVEHTKPEHLYKLSAAAFYRKQISLELWRRLGPALPPGQKMVTDSDALVLQQMLLSNGNLNPAGVGEGEFSVRLDSLAAAQGTLGLTLTETHGGRAVVQKVSPDGIVWASGIKPGDYIVGVGSEREWRYKAVLPRIIAWASPQPTFAAQVAKISNKKSRKGKEEFLTLAVWRPQWQPDAFLVHAIQGTQGGVLADNSGHREDAKTTAQRTIDLLSEESVNVGGGIGAQDWKSFMKVSLPKIQSI